MEESRKFRRPFTTTPRPIFWAIFPIPCRLNRLMFTSGYTLGGLSMRILYSDYFEEEASGQIFRFKRREISCTILSEIWMDTLALSFSPRGQHVYLLYYGGGLYRADYDELLVKSLPSIYHVTDSWRTTKNEITDVHEVPGLEEVDGQLRYSLKADQIISCLCLLCVPAHRQAGLRLRGLELPVLGP